MKNKKADITVQTIFYILMSIIFIGILIFGFQKIFDVEKTLSKQEQIEIKKELKSAIEYCDEPLNKGSMRTFEIKSYNFNFICIIGEDFESRGLSSHDDLRSLYEADQNVVLIKSSSFKKDASNNIEFIDYNVVDAFKVDTFIETTFCWDDYNSTGYLRFPIECVED